jgi:hypothetical protein
MNKENTRYVYRRGKRIEVETLNLDHLAPSPPRRKRDKPEGFSLDRFKSKRTPALAAVPKRRERHKNFAIVPLDDNLGYQAATAAGNGAAIILCALQAADWHLGGADHGRRAQAVRALAEDADADH